MSHDSTCCLSYGAIHRLPARYVASNVPCLENTLAVSYTHLDVYKRQPLFNVSIVSFAAFAAGTPKGPAAAPERKVTMPMRYFPLSAATAEADIPVIKVIAAAVAARRKVWHGKWAVDFMVVS